MKASTRLRGKVVALKSEQSGIVDAHRDTKRFVVRADEKLTAVLEVEAAIRGCGQFDKSMRRTITDETWEKIEIAVMLVEARHSAALDPILHSR